MPTTFISPSKHLGRTIKSNLVLSNTAPGMSAIAPQERTFQIQHSANKQYHPFRANHGFREVRLAPMSEHRETWSPSPTDAISEILRGEKQRAFSKNPGGASTDRHNIDARNADRRYKFEPRRGY